MNGDRLGKSLIGGRLGFNPDKMLQSAFLAASSVQLVLFEEVINRVCQLFLRDLNR